MFHIIALLAWSSLVVLPFRTLRSTFLAAGCLEFAPGFSMNAALHQDAPQQLPDLRLSTSFGQLMSRLKISLFTIVDFSRLFFLLRREDG